jgi:hypothetical protein
MIDVHGFGAYGIFPFLSDDVIKQAKLANIKTRAGKLAYLLSLKGKAKKPVIKDGIRDAQGALKWIAEELKPLDEARGKEDEK